MTLSASLVAMALLVGTAATPAAAAILLVDDDGVECPFATYTMIQAAVTDADPNDTIEVCPGSYTESVTITKPLTLLGPNAGTSWDESRGDEATVTSPGITFLMLPGDGVTLDGFTITGSFGIYVTGSANNTLIQNNITTGTTRALTSDSGGSNLSVLDNDLVSNVRSFHLDGAYTDMEVAGNRFSGAAASPGIFFLGGPPNSIDGFEFTGNEVLHPANMASNISNATVSGNTFDAALPGDETLLISLQDSTVTDNTFEGDDEIACLLLWGSQFGLVPSETVTISDNTFSNCGTAGPSGNFAIHLSQDVRDIDITNNAISSGVEGVNTDDSAMWDVTDEIHINFNNITDNTSFGVRNGQMGVLDAECNWWGAADGPGPVGPGSGDNVSTNVDFTPWLVGPAPGGPCVGGVAPPERVTGGGQINVTTGGVGSFGFNAKPETQSGHLNYLNHATREKLNCAVNAVTVISATQAQLSGTCRDGRTFMAEVEDNGEPGKDLDKFTITYNGTTDQSEDGTIRSGNIQIHLGGAAGGSSAGVTGAGEGAFPSGATFNGISLSGLEVGTGVSIASDGTAAGQVVAVLLGTSLLGQPQEINVDGKVRSGSVGPDGSVTFSGSATVDLGDGSLPLIDVPFTVTATTESVLVKLDTSTLPSATLTGGSITIE